MATSVISAVFEVYNGIAAPAFGGTARPPIHLGEAAQTTTAGAQLRPDNGYIVMYDDSFVPVYDSSFGGTEGGSIRFEVYAIPLGSATAISVDSIVAGLKFGGFAPGAKRGLDFATLPLEGYYSTVSVKRVKEQRSYAGFNRDGQRCHKCDLTYRVVLGLSAT